MGLDGNEAPSVSCCSQIYVEIGSDENNLTLSSINERRLHEDRERFILINKSPPVKLSLQRTIQGEVLFQFNEVQFYHISSST